MRTPSTTHDNVSLQALQKALWQQLTLTQHLWRPAPFTTPTPDWVTTHPELAQHCLTINENQLRSLETNPAILQEWLIPLIPQLKAIRDLTKLPPAKKQPTTFPKQWHAGIPGRKAKQIESFVQTVKQRGTSWVDWCSGKAHLGRTLATVNNAKCLALEYSPTLCKQGAELALKQKSPTQFVAIDVLQRAITMPEQSHVTALHACGDLHRTLVKQIVSQAKQRYPVSALSLAPCCYALWIEDEYIPLSPQAQKDNLNLTRNELNLAVQEYVTASKKEREKSQQQAEWRLGFDCLQKHINQTSNYLNTPSLPAKTMRQGFHHYCQTLADLKHITIPENTDWQHFLHQGQTRYQTQRRLQLVRHAFRRAIELWLVLDLAAYLEQAGYQVTLSEFCQRELTPRNILLEAQLD